MEKGVFDLLVDISNKDFLDLTDNSRISNRDKAILESERQRKLDYLLNQGLITRTGDIYIITEYGFVVSQYNSWSDYLYKQKLSLRKKDQKETLDLKISEFQVRTKFLPYYISFLSIIISVLALFNPFEISNKKIVEKSLKVQKLKPSITKKTIQKDSVKNVDNKKEK